MKGEKVSDGLSAAVKLDLNTSGGTATHVVELVVGDDILIGKYTSATQAPAVFVQGEDIKVSLSVMQSDGVTEYNYQDEAKTIYVQENPIVSASYTLAKNRNEYSFGAEDQFEWSSNNVDVAKIDSQGKITPTGKSGEASFTLTAKNGSVEGKAVSVTTDTLKFGAGLTPFLLIPNGSLRSVSGRDVTVYWSSNVCDKNGDVPTDFKVTVARNNSDEDAWFETVSGTAASPAASCTIPGTELTFDYAENHNTFTVKVEVNFNEQTLEAAATISIDSQPAVVGFEKLGSYYITDTAGVVPIQWNVKNFNNYGDDSNLFEFLVTRGASEVVRLTSPGEETAPGTGEFNFTYPLEIEDVKANAEDPTSYREVYTVTIKAKNGSDSTWSYDSFLLYVYDEGALKIMVDGEAAGSVTMSNVEKISQMSQEQILALKRDIYLKNIISVNYGEYAWTEVADQIRWASEDSSVASVNYQQGTLYENLENLSYESYRPNTDLGLSGLKDGQTLVSAVHKLTNMSEELDVTVETLKDKLYLFQCYPQAVTTLTYIGSDGQQHVATSDANGAAAVYDAGGIQSDVYCNAMVNGAMYLGTFYQNQLVSGEGDWTKLERYPLNNMELRRAAYAYLYLKNPDGTPCTGQITFRGGVYLNGVYQDKAKFNLTGSQDVDAWKAGNEDTVVTLDGDGKLTVIMDQNQWDVEDGAVKASDTVNYVFELKAGDSYYPMLIDVSANVSQDAFVSNGEAIVNFRANDSKAPRPFITRQTLRYEGSDAESSVLESTGNVGVTQSLPQAYLSTYVMWWGEEEVPSPKLQLVTEYGVNLAAGAGQYTLEESPYPFLDETVSRYTVTLNEDTFAGTVPLGKKVGVYLDYYKDGSALSRHEVLPFKVTNLLHVEKVEDASSITALLHKMGSYSGTDGSKAGGMDFGDEFVSIAMNLLSSEDYTPSNEKLFNIQLAPTSDPTKFLGFITVNVGNMPETQMNMGANLNVDELHYGPGLNELLFAIGKRNGAGYLENAVDKGRHIKFGFEGYMESLIYFNYDSGKWEIQILNGGFDAGGGLAYTFEYNTWCGPVPIIVQLTLGGTVDVGMDALTVSYVKNGEPYLGTDFLTELHLFFYLRFFAGVGFDYSVVAFKLGVYGQIDVNMRFDWLNRPYMEDGAKNVADGGTKEILNGQNFRIDGEIGLEFEIRLLFVRYQKVLASFAFNMLNKSTNDWVTIQSAWDANQKAQKQAISSLLGTNSISLQTIGGQQMMSLNLAPTLESRDYLSEGTRRWGQVFSLMALDPDEQQGLNKLESNTYPYANPVVSDDGQIVVYLSDMDSTDVDNTRAVFATKTGVNGTYTKGGIIDNNGFGDSQAALSGTKNFAVSAWTRQTASLQKDAGSELTTEDQMFIMNNTEIYAGVYKDGKWTSQPLTEDFGADLAPVVAAKTDEEGNNHAIVVWRSVASSAGETDGGYAGITTFDEKDTILYSIYNGSTWSDAQTLYNGTSGSVKGIVAAMLEDGTAAVAYTLDQDRTDSTLTDREVYYAVVNPAGEVTRNVRATNDSSLDENPQISAVTFPSDPNGQRFVLGWYTQEDASGSGDAASDIRLIDFNAEGVTGQLLPDSISQVAAAGNVNITPDFRFTKAAKSISDLSILWVERAQATANEVGDGSSLEPSKTTSLENAAVDRDVLKGVKFYTYGLANEMVSFTGAVDVAEMGDGTLIDHFDAYVSNPEANEIKAVILGTTYGEGGTETKIGTTVGGDTVQYTVPSRTTAMYTATETYEDKITVASVLPEYDTVRKGAVTQLLFTVENNGIHAIHQLEFQVGEQITTFEDLNLLPGGNIQLYADYLVPQDKVADPAYTVTASFSQDVGAAGSAKTEATAKGTIYLDVPDVEITDAAILAEENGSRIIQIKLNNDSDADLASSSGSRQVQIGFYSDATCEHPIEGLNPLTISDAKDLKMLDEGGYSVQATFNVQEYLPKLTEDNGGEPLTEIPADGIPVYIKAEVQDSLGAMPEPVTSNNYASVTVENLKVRTGQDVSITSDLAIDGDTATATVSVSLQNNRLSSTETGNVIVTLLDADGKVLAVQQSYTGGESDSNGLLTLKGEQKSPSTFKFESVPGAASVQVAYSDLIIGGDNADLASLSFSGINVTLADFKEDLDQPGTYRAQVAADDLTSTLVTASTESTLSKVSLTSETEGRSNLLSETVPLRPGEVNTITVTVSSDSEEKINTYILTIQNNGDPTITWPDDEGSDAQAGTYGTSVVYAADAAVIRLSATPTPDVPDGSGYQLSYQWYTCDVAGENCKIMEGETGSTLTIPNTTDVGTYYYCCEVIRHLLDGKTRSYWSSVATVQINLATDNSVALTGTEVTYDGEPHGLTSAEAAKENSTLLYSTDKGENWSKEAPEFTEAGVHTVWVKATNPNYVETAEVTADVIIQQAPGNEVSVEGTEVIYDGNGHGLTSVKAAKGGSTFWYSTDSSGENWSKETPAFTEAGEYTVWVKATNPNYIETEAVQGTVVIGIASGNKVTVEDTEVVYDGQPHGLTSAVAAMKGSTLLYSTDGSNSEAWSEEAPVFTEAGEYTVWVKAANHNYEETEAVQGTVTIRKASGNKVTVEGTEVTFDAHAHGLTRAEAAMEGSVVLYSTDGGKTWSEKAPTFIAAGEHIVWVKATNPNYEETPVETGKVIIHESTEAVFELKTQDLDKAFKEYPQEIQEKYAGAAEMEAALRTEVTESESDVPVENTAVYDVELLFSVDGKEYQVATAENFPGEGITVVLPYPEGTSKDNCTFVLKHLIVDPLGTGKKAGTIEEMKIELTDDGIQFQTDCLSPFVLGWTKWYTVSVEEVSHGTVSVDPEKTIEGEPVTITAVPDSGYRLGPVTVSTAAADAAEDSQEVEVSDQGDGVWTFDMPGADVVVSVQFNFIPVIVPDEQGCNGGEDCPSRTFPDLDVGEWYHEYTDYVITHGLMNGTGEGLFVPGGTVTRAQMVSVLWNMKGRPVVNYYMTFQDVSEEAWYAEAVRWAASEGIAGGYGDGRFGPDDPVTREQMALMVYHYEQKYGSGGFTGSWMYRLPFQDLDQISEWAFEAVAWCNMNQVLGGRDNGLFDPKGTALRCEVASIVSRYHMLREAEEE